MHFFIKMPKIPLDRYWVCIAPSKLICYFIFNMFYAFSVTCTDFKGLKYSFSNENCLQIMHFHKTWLTISIAFTMTYAHFKGLIVILR